jgi:Sugar (and other) transporter
VIRGPIADRFGRKPTMTLSILLFGVATAPAGISTSLWEWNAFRFVAAIGIGGEWAMAGPALRGHAGSLSLPLSLTSIVFLLGILLVGLAPKTRGQAIPDWPRPAGAAPVRRDRSPGDAGVLPRSRLPHHPSPASAATGAPGTVLNVDAAHTFS